MFHRSEGAYLDGTFAAAENVSDFGVGERDFGELVLVVMACLRVFYEIGIVIDGGLFVVFRHGVPVATLLILMRITRVDPDAVDQGNGFFVLEIQEPDGNTVARKQLVKLHE